MPTFSSYAGQLAAKLQDFRTIGQKEASKSRPPSDAIALDQHEASLTSEAEKHLNAEQFLFDSALTDASREAVQAKQKSIQHQFEVEQLVSDNGTLDAVEAELANERQGLVRATEARMRTEQDLNYFRAANNINEEAHYPESRILHIGLVAVLAVVEMLINTFFFENEQGLIGGFFVAAGIAIVNLAGAFFLGIAFRYKNLATSNSKILAWLAIVFFIVLTIFSNSLFAAFRSEYQLVADPTEPAQVSAAFLRAWPEAVAIFRLDMQVKDQMSFVLLILGIILSIVAFWKGYTLDDKYPDYGRKDRKHRKLLADEHRLQELTRQKVKELLHQRKAIVHAAIQEPSTQAGMIAKRIADLQHAKTLFESQAAAIDREFAMVVEAYRHANVAVRVTPAPQYFKEKASIALRADSSGYERVNRELVEVQTEIKSRSDQFKEPLQAKLRELQGNTAEVLKKTMGGFMGEVQREAEELVSAGVQTIHRLKTN